ncbi:flavodoxin-dependent (E)-4-hydroxy-3-methylbut-2-enyl-diphosphate synthase [Streptomyces sp. NPDC004610]|uniref:flavodoxin-dependent (E)-4-hydroxy-3-methylbut-2-enyl-diphosphate synthase n=1 Tax=unclassified Streptomyces TaxID=2593676 RepID=UPI0033A74ABC
MTAISLGIPEVPARPIAARRVSRRIQVGPVAVGGGAPVSAQSMTTTHTSDIGATLQQIAERMEQDGAAPGGPVVTVT